MTACAHAAAQATARARIPPGFDMNVSILTSGYWPTYPILDAVLPEELSSSQVWTSLLGFGQTSMVQAAGCSCNDA
jgi:hypothetical protein